MDNKKYKRLKWWQKLLFHFYGTRLTFSIMIGGIAVATAGTGIVANLSGATSQTAQVLAGFTFMGLTITVMKGYAYFLRNVGKW